MSGELQLRPIGEKLSIIYQAQDGRHIMSTLGIKPPGGCHFPLVGNKVAIRIKPEENATSTCRQSLRLLVLTPQELLQKALTTNLRLEMKS